MQSKIRRLKEYFRGREDVRMAFVFGSRAKKRAGGVSDWDIAVYFQTDGACLEWQSDHDFPQGVGSELARWAELRNIPAHEYLDIRWKRIEDFVNKGEPSFRSLAEAVMRRL